MHAAASLSDTGAEFQPLGRRYVTSLCGQDKAGQCTVRRSLGEQDRHHLVELDVDVESDAEEVDDKWVGSETFQSHKLVDQSLEPFCVGLFGILGAECGAACGWDFEGKSVSFAQARLDDIRGCASP